MKFELLVIRCLLNIVKVLYQLDFGNDARYNLYDMEQELRSFKRDLKQQQPFEETH